MNAEADIVIVGAGVVGLSIAWSLRDSGAKIVVIDRQQPGQGASWAGGGILWPLPPDHIDPVIEPLLTRSLSLYPRFCAQIHELTGIDPQYWACGARYVADGREQAFPQIGQIRNPRLLQSLAEAVRRSGIEIIADVEATGWISAGGSLRGIRTSVGDFACRKAVLAAGAWSAKLLDLPVRPIKGEMVLLRAAPGELEEIVIGSDVYLVPRRDGLVLVGSTLEDVGFDTTPTEHNRDWLLGRARQLHAGVDRWPIERHWAGLRPGVGEGYPIISGVPSMAGLYCCTGHYRIGLTLAPASAERIAGLMLGTIQSNPAGPFEYRPR
ncbi:FAD-dependent oxidoreductase [Sinimarinibacterium sp. CAU 1509]|uniref:NAD(P)/FAD-dependent oxidoreductase n=1 Tax=Sinimarinibacterium sp. CAU 1509 TaxID=2562283 RepID=UPI0010AB9A3E|nr:FAD-dependent oxidoreductase [Sinimarinibacterium sp. CAU 1509]TJY62071.1 FAD-dependent oxidoreductase [Sinimarinibacterium sp. CAU 1509]